MIELHLASVRTPRMMRKRHSARFPACHLPAAGARPPRSSRNCKCPSTKRGKARARVGMAESSWAAENRKKENNRSFPTSCDVVCVCVWFRKRMNADRTFFGGLTSSSFDPKSSRVVSERNWLRLVPVLEGCILLDSLFKIFPLGVQKGCSVAWMWFPLFVPSTCVCFVCSFQYPLPHPCSSRWAPNVLPLFPSKTHRWNAAHGASRCGRNNETLRARCPKARHGRTTTRSSWRRSWHVFCVRSVAIAT